MTPTIRIRWPSDISIVDQIVAQIELQILAGERIAGEPLPSVRALARRLGTRAATVHAAYRRLHDHGNVSIQPGAGAQVLRGERSPGRSPRTVDEALGLAARLAIGASEGPDELRRVLAAWSAQQPLRGVAAVDTARETAELMAAELGLWTVAPVRPLTLDEVEAAPTQLTGWLTVALPFHGERIARLTPRPLLLPLRLDLAACSRMVAGLPAGGSLLVVSHSPRVPPYARAEVERLRGDDVLVTCHLAGQRAAWRRSAAAADHVLADVLSWPAVSKVRPDAERLQLFDAAAARAIASAVNARGPGDRRRRQSSGSRSSAGATGSSTAGTPRYR